MKTSKKSVFALQMLVILTVNSLAQNTELFMPHNVREAYKNQTRSMDGTPGQNYWQNRSDYIMDINFEPASRKLTGKAEIVYFNNSPDSIGVLTIQLYPTLFKKGQARDIPVAYIDENDGVTIDEIAVNEVQIDSIGTNKSLAFYKTTLMLSLDSKIAPAGKVKLTIGWHYTVNSGSHIRTGAVDSTTFFIAYFFPHIGVYDDIDGWDPAIYYGLAEFYNDFGDYNVNISVPKNYLVWATGLLQNPQDVLNAKYLQRYQSAFTADEIVHIIDSTEMKRKDITRQDSLNSWSFRAENVPDFAFALSDHYLWDATSIAVDKESGRRVMIDAAYNKTSADFLEIVTIARQTIDFTSNDFPAVPFPYPQMTIFNGLSEMEYPMMVNNRSVYPPGTANSPGQYDYLVRLTAHEVFHSYFPFYMGINEKKYAWMDEGWASFGDYLIGKKVNPNGKNPLVPGVINQQYYNFYMGSQLDIPIIASSWVIKSPIHQGNSYAKAALFYLALQDLLGPDLFRETIREYMKRWHGKHPTPYDFFFTLNEASGQNLNWLIKPWFFEFGYPDLAIKSVSQQSGKCAIEIKRIGNYPVPIHLTLTFADQSTKIVHETVSVWKNNDTAFTVSVAGNERVTTVELGDIIIPDADLSNNSWRDEKHED